MYISSLALILGSAFCLVVCWFTTRRWKEKEPVLPFGKRNPKTSRAQHGATAEYFFERRLHKRRRTRPVQALIARAADTGKPVRACIQDHSPIGLSLFLAAKHRQFASELRVGTQVQLLPVESADVLPWVDAAVIRCDKSPKGWVIGCRFAKEMPLSVLLHFG